MSCVLQDYYCVILRSEVLGKLAALKIISKENLEQSWCCLLPTENDLRSLPGLDMVMLSTFRIIILFLRNIFSILDFERFFLSIYEKLLSRYEVIGRGILLILVSFCLILRNYSRLPSIFARLLSSFDKRHKPLFSFWLVFIAI